MPKGIADQCRDGSVRLESLTYRVHMPTENELLSEERLELSGVVANCRMNRERSLHGSNGYSKELGFDPLNILTNRSGSGRVRWLDLCCGSGNALIEAAMACEVLVPNAAIEIVGVDLVGLFSRPVQEVKGLRLIQASLGHWVPEGKFDLITCVHGLHYIGDKLGLIEQAASWLTANGRFTASFSFENVRFCGNCSSQKVVVAELRKSGLTYDGRRKRIHCEGQRVIELPYRYLGADDQAGPNYTGQAAVNSYYEWSKCTSN
jgi:SAM-dependent methyltransferase